MAIDQSQVIIRLISIVLGAVSASFGFYFIYKFRRIDKVTLGGVLIALGIILVLFGGGVIRFAWSLW